MFGLRAAASSFPDGAVEQDNVGKASARQTEQRWRLANGLRIVTYEFLERSRRTNDLSADEILATLDRFGGCDLMLIKGSHYWQRRFDESSWSYPRFHQLAEKLIPKLHARGIKGAFSVLRIANALTPEVPTMSGCWRHGNNT